MWDELLLHAGKQGIELPPGAEGSFDRFYYLLTEANRELNLTRITEPTEVMIKHFLDSLEILAWQPELQGKMIDVGSGAGLPGIPLKIARPALDVTLLDSSQKKVRFLTDTALQLGLSGISARHGRAEDMAKLPQWRDSFDFVVSRALASLNILLELCLPFVIPGGHFIAYKGPSWENELKEAGPALAQLNGCLLETRQYALPHNLGTRTLIIFKKTGITPPGFPRRAGIANKRPLV
jgi:16S rRNA (guanine527-N7)-methyltransferase